MFKKYVKQFLTDESGMELLQLAIITNGRQILRISFILVMTVVYIPVLAIVSVMTIMIQPEM